MTHKYIHLREYHEGGPLAKGGWTVRFEHFPEVNKYAVVVSKCNPKDHYCKRIGRSIVDGRHEQGKWELFPGDVPIGSTATGHIIEQLRAADWRIDQALDIKEAYGY